MGGELSKFEETPKIDLLRVLPGELFCRIALFLPPKSLLSFFLIKKRVLQDIEKHGFYELKCKVCGYEIPEGLDARDVVMMENKFETQIFRDFISDFKINEFKITDSWMGNSLDFSDLVDKVEVSKNAKNARTWRLLESGEIQIAVVDPNFRFSCFKMHSYKWLPDEHDFEIVFKLHSQNMKSIKFGILGTDMKSSRQYNYVLNAYCPSDYEIDSGDELKLTFDRSLVADGMDLKIPQKGKSHRFSDSHHGFTPSAHDLQIFRFYVTFTNEGDALEILSIKKKVERVVERLDILEK